MNLKTQLQQLYEQYELDLADYGWMSEADRWAELVFCLLNECTEQEPEPTRIAVSLLQYLELLEVEKLAALEEPSDENAIILAYVLKQHGFSERDTGRATSLLAQVAKVIQKDCGGKIQRYLRRHGESMRDELVSAFTGESLTETQLRYAISYWLQNALSLPISLEHQAVVRFCEENGASLEDLWQAADEFDLNLALVDDLLEIDQMAREATAEE